MCTEDTQNSLCEWRLRDNPVDVLYDQGPWPSFYDIDTTYQLQRLTTTPTTAIELVSRPPSDRNRLNIGRKFLPWSPDPILADGFVVFVKPRRSSQEESGRFEADARLGARQLRSDISVSVSRSPIHAISIDVHACGVVTVKGLDSTRDRD